jgi:pimeloyl-ACP methyl ester carboxylesterase
VNNGPWGRALTTELIPFLERKYRMDAKTPGRFLNGHSSGGWATMWLQVTYPEIFGGTWSTSPDPVDFRDFTNIDLYADTNAFRQRDGTRTPLVRESGHTTETLEQYAGQEAVLGEYGGQMASFEWVFSPRAVDGRPAPMFNRQSGEIDRAVVEHWRRYDIATIMTSNARQLVKQLRRKVHIIVGTQDTFYLDEPARLLQERLAPLGYDAKFTYLAGRTHFDLYNGGLMTRIAQQMYAVARPGAKWQPKIIPDPATELTR